MPMETLVALALVSVPFVLFATVLAYGDITWNRRPKGRHGRRVGVQRE